MGREKFIDYLVREKLLRDIVYALTTNPDIYDDEIANINKRYYRALDKMEKLGLTEITNSTFHKFDEDEPKAEEEEKLEELKKKSKKRVEKMVKEFEKSKGEGEKWAEEYEKESKQEAEEWVKQYEKSILDFFISPSERQMIRTQLAKLIPEQKKFIVDMVLHSKALLSLDQEGRRKYVADFIKQMAKQTAKY
jgi:DNA-directed RNA polymerase beta' subunit